MVHAYDRLGARLARGELPAEGLQEPTRRLLELVDGEVRSVRIETFEADHVITARERDHLLADREEEADGMTVWREHDVVTIGAVRGRVQTLTSRAGLRFTLYDLVHDKAVTCYLRPGHEEIMRDLWGELVTVHGRVRREAETGRPMTIRDVRRIEPLPEGDRGSWKRARGVREDALPAEDRIRRIRDAW